MRRSTIALTASTATLVVGCSLFLLHRQRDSHPKSEGEGLSQPAADEPPLRNGQGPAPNIAALWGEVISLRHDIEALKAELSRHPQAADQEPNSPAPGRSEQQQHEPAWEAKKKAEAGKAVREAVARAEDRFVNEPFDASWASARRAGIQGVADRNEAIRNALRGADCRSHTCRIELLDNAAANLNQNLPAFLSELATTLPNVTTDRVVGADGTSSYILYLTSGT